MRLLSLLLVLLAAVVAGEQQENSLYKVCRPVSLAMDVLFLLDGSGSVSGNTFEMQMNMLRKVFDLMQPAHNKSRLAVMQYAGYTRMELPFAENRTYEDVLNALSRVKYMSGSTKTGKALKKARDILRQERNKKDAETFHQVAIVVSDGHSHDDPMKAAASLRSDGVSVVVLGIGHHINRNELLQITQDEELAFQDLNREKNLLQFEERFGKISTQQRCEHFRGKEGAETQCFEDRFILTVSTTKRLEGALYVTGHYRNPNCVSKISREVREVNSTYYDTMITVLYSECGVHESYMDSPQGQLFSSTVILQFDPALATEKDFRFNVRCFKGEEDFSHRYLDDSIFLPPSPCRYMVRPQGRCDGITVADPLIHSWTCDYDDVAITVHSCEAFDPSTLQNYRLIDENGCSHSPFLSSVNHTGAAAIARGPAIRFPSSPLVIFRCGLRICRGEHCKPKNDGCRKKRELRVSENEEFTAKGFDRDYAEEYEEIAVAAAARNSGDDAQRTSSTTIAMETTNPAIGHVRPLSFPQSTVFPSFEVILSTQGVSIIDKEEELKEISGRIASLESVDVVLEEARTAENKMTTQKIEKETTKGDLQLIVFGKSGDLERVTPQTPTTFSTTVSREPFPTLRTENPESVDEMPSSWQVVDVFVESEPLLIRLENELFTTSCPKRANK